MQSGFSGQVEPVLAMPSAAISAALGMSAYQPGSVGVHLTGSVSHRAPGKRAAMSAGRGAMDALAAPTSTWPAPRATAVAGVEDAAVPFVPVSAGAVTPPRTLAVGERPMPAQATETIRAPVRPEIRVKRTTRRMGTPGSVAAPGFVVVPAGSCGAAARGGGCLAVTQHNARASTSVLTRAAPPPRPSDQAVVRGGAVRARQRVARRGQPRP